MPGGWPRQRWWWLLCLGWLWAGHLMACGGALKVSAEVVSPASVPVMAFPVIWVAGGHLEEDELVLKRLISQLQQSTRHQVHRVELSQLEPLRGAGSIPATSVVMVLEVRVSEDVRRVWDSSPTRVCGAFGCSTRYQSAVNDVPWLRGVVAMHVYDGPTARLLQRHLVRAEAQGGDVLEMRQDVSRELARRVAEAVRADTTQVEVVLFRVDHPLVEQALSTIQGGDWPGGRALLEKAVADAGALEPDERARMYFDLGQARRFAPAGSDPLGSFDQADQALRRAIELDDEEPYRRALRELGSHRKGYEKLVEQRQAARHNFALSQRQAGAPPVPSSYQTALPPIPPVGVSPAASTEVPASPEESSFEPPAPRAP